MNLFDLHTTTLTDSTLLTSPCLNTLCTGSQQEPCVI